MTRDLEAHLQRQIDRSTDFFWHRLRWDVVSGYLPGGTFQLVDIGAGAGVLGHFLGRDRPEARYRFIEPITSLEQHLEKIYGADANTAGKTSFEGIGYVTLLDVLEHQEDDRAFLEDLASKMRPGALLLMTVPALQRLWSGWDVALGHHRRYSRESLLEVLDGLPFEMIEASYLFPELVPAAKVRSMRRKAVEGEVEESTAFPDLPAPLNGLLYRIGRASMRRRNRWRRGTSLFTALRRTE